MSTGTSLSAKGLNKDQLRWFYFLTGFFMLFSAIAIVKGFLFITGLPVVFFILLLTVFHLDTVAFLAVFVTPLSINLAKTSIGIGVSLPSEPIMFGLFLIFWLKVFADGGLDKKILHHPVTLLIIGHLMWFFFTTLTSSMPIVSIKSTLARFCYVSVFYFMFLYLFSKYRNIKKFLWMYMVPLLMVIFYTLANHIAANLSEDAAHISMTPFYNDHTAYAAVICFFIPVLFALTFDKKTSKKAKYVAGIFLFIFLTATILSYTRAAWVGLVAALCAYFAFLFRLKSALIYGGFTLLIVLAILFRTQITMDLESNSKVSSSDYASHVQSIGNISTDDSNLERLNRWACALRMWTDHPLLGFGPGTYMFKYAPYQKFSQRSGISTNNATGGGSHSEILGPLSEQGILGPIFYLLIGIVVAVRTSSFLKRSKDSSVKALARGLLLGLVTYWVHGFLNYFLDTEKASVPYWGFIAALVALDIFHEDHAVSDLSDQATTEQSDIVE
ncbi:hypothetical protein BH11BAC2_BH11BAC2_07720 [soil metagenome]